MAVKHDVSANNLTTIKKKKRVLTTSDWQLYSLCLIPVLLVFIFSYIPMFGVILAFKNYKFNLGILGSPWVGLSNFEFFFKSNVFTQLVWNTISNNFLFIVFGIVASLIVAILLFELKSRNATKTFQTMLITPHFMSWVIVSYMVYAILNPNYGYLNQLLSLFGIDKIDWYSKPYAWPVILTITFVWKNVGMDSVVYYAALMGIDTSLFEAAEVDGANKLHCFFKITLPMLSSIIFFNLIMQMITAFKEFNAPYLITNGGPLNSTYLYGMMLYDNAFKYMKMGYASAESWFLFVIIMILTAATFKSSPYWTYYEDGGAF